MPFIRAGQATTEPSRIIGRDQTPVRRVYRGETLYWPTSLTTSRYYVLDNTADIIRVVNGGGSRVPAEDVTLASAYYQGVFHDRFVGTVFLNGTVNQLQQLDSAGTLSVFIPLTTPADTPWRGIAAGNDRYYIVDNMGRLRIYNRSRARQAAEEFTISQEVLGVAAGGERIFFVTPDDRILVYTTAGALERTITLPAGLTHQGIFATSTRVSVLEESANVAAIRVYGHDGTRYANEDASTNLPVSADLVGLSGLAGTIPARLLCVDGSSKELWDIDRENPATASTVLGTLPAALNAPRGISQSEDTGELLLAAANSSDLWAVNVGDPSRSVVLDFYPRDQFGNSRIGFSNGFAWHVGEYYIADTRNNNLWLVNRDDASTSTLLGDLPFGLTAPRSLISHNDQLLVWNGNGGPGGGYWELDPASPATVMPDTGLRNPPSYANQIAGSASHNGELLAFNPSGDKMYLVDASQTGDARFTEIGSLPADLTNPAGACSYGPPG